MKARESTANRATVPIMARAPCAMTTDAVDTT